MPEKRRNKSSAHTKHVAKRGTAKKAAKPVAKVKKTAAEKPAKSAVNVVSLYDLKGASKEKVTIDPLFVKDHVNTDVIYQAVLMYQAGQRDGNAATKTRGEVRGGGKKPWKQKGTGQARHGSRRSPIWRGGGATFGPHPRDYSYGIPVEIRRRAVIEGLKDKIHNGKLMMIEEPKFATPKTAVVAEFMDTMKLVKPLVVVEKKDANLMLASRNIRQMTVKTALELNALDVVSAKECLMTKGAYSGLLKRLS